jgi:hypothetical protein
LSRRHSTLWLALSCAVAFALALSPLSAAGPDAAKRVVRGLGPAPGAAIARQADRPPGATPGDGGPSHAIFPPQKLTIRFNHRLHVKQLGLGCISCHQRATTSTSSADRLLPAPVGCDGCHGSDHRRLEAVQSDPERHIAQCGFCHLGYDPAAPARVARLVLEPPALKFDHARHARRNIGCAQCHGEVQNLELATRDQLPRMQGCLRCHGKQGEARGEASGACTTCHLAESGQRLKTKLPGGALLPPRWMNDSDHGADWIERHKHVAGVSSSFCASCHQERECIDCHDGRVRPRSVHPNDWLNLHAAVAAQGDPSCTSCHRRQSFCTDCHQRTGVVMSGAFGNFAARGRFHLPKSAWTDGPISAQHHGTMAKRNLSACVSCHSERDCVLCHASASQGGLGFAGRTGQGGGLSPHPPGFSAGCAGALRRNARPCLVCHHPADPTLDACRRGP